MVAFVLKYIKKDTRFVLLNMLFIFGQVLINSLFLMQEMKNIIDQGVGRQDMQYIWQSGARMLGWTVLAGICVVVASLFSAKTVAHVVCGIREDCFRKAASLAPQEFAHFGESTLLMRTTSDAFQVQNLLMNLLRSCMMVPMNILVMLFLIYRMNRTIFWILSGIFVLTIGMLLWMGRRTRPRFEHLQQKTDHITLLMKEKITGVRYIRALGNERLEEAKMSRANSEAYDAAIKANARVNFLSPLSLVMMNWAVVLIYLAASAQLRAKMASVSDLLLVFQYLAYFISSLAVIPTLVNLVPRAAVAAGRIRELLEYEGTRDGNRDGGKAALPADGKGDIVFDDVIFGYAGAVDVIAHVSFTAEAGKTTAIIGTTGSGKSTLMNLVMGFYEPTFGEIRVDGVPLRKMDREAYRKHLSFAPQKPMVFQDTVRANITMYDDRVSEERIQAACAASCLDEVLEKIPGGLDAVMTQGGMNLSGGQRQRLSLARTLARDARIYLVDDSFSALDAVTERKALEGMSKILAGKTVLMVAQKISTIRNADRIVVLERGRVAGVGTHDELLEGCAEYRAIYETQSYLAAESHAHLRDEATSSGHLTRKGEGAP